jgi:5-methylcytosine-specific restriction endonuclease McrA
LLRDRRCQHPGCRIPAHDCQVDHLVPHSKDGRTNQRNGRAACDHHNRFKSDSLPDDLGHAYDETGWDPPLHNTG